ncbi:MAG: LPS export ABC transporter periplasmic protein LptC [Caulobacterales bacterium]|nr:LPS export ABC transporter periplasmic protein LptC [Caulobacterales bacterium]
MKRQVSTEWSPRVLATPLRAALGLAFAGLLATGAHAQLAPNSGAPVDITADELEAISSRCLSIWRGNAEALQDTSRLRARIINVYAKPKPGGGEGLGRCGVTDRLEAEGDVYYVTPEQTVKGDRAVYTADTDTIVMTGNVIAVQGKSVARGERMTVQVKSGQVQMESNVKGRGRPGRPRGVFYSEEQPARSSTPATPAPPVRR